MPPRKGQLVSVPTEQKAGRMASAVRETVDALVLQPEDVAISELAIQYAETLDRTAAIAARAANLPATEDIAEELDRLRKRVSAQVAMADLGPKLQAALDALGATPKARAANGKPAGPGRSSKLASLRTGNSA